MNPVRALAVFAAAGLLSAALPALADDASPGHDDVVYDGNPAASFTASDPETIVTPEVTYPGPHQATFVSEPGPSRESVAFDDTVYPVRSAPPARQPVPERRVEERLACGCARG